MTGAFLIFAQLAAPSVAQAPPDIELKATIRARQVRIEQAGSATLDLSAQPGIAPPVRIERSQTPGKSTYRNLTIKVQGEARLTDGRTKLADKEGETE